MSFYQGHFKRGANYTVVRSIKLTATETLEPGSHIFWKKRALKVHHLQSLFRRRLIGLKGSDWVKSMLAGYKNNDLLRRPEVVDNQPKKEEKETDNLKKSEVVSNLIEDKDSD